MLFNNQISPCRKDWTNISLAIRPQGAGALFEEMTLDERIGPEAVALLIDTAPEELLAKRTLTIELKAGIASTKYGPVLFLVWWMPPMANGKPFALYEQLMNPLNLGVSGILARVADQTHLHIVLLNIDGQVQTVFEYENNFGFDAIHAGVQGARVAWQGPADFNLAKQAYQQDYDIYELLAGVYG
jgi:hypothetical protein